MTAPRRQFCTGGHDRTLPGALYSNGQCRACKRAYNQERERLEREQGSAKRGADAVSRTERMLALWSRLEIAPPYEKTDIRREIAALQRN